MKTELERALNDAVVRRLAGDHSYRRGTDYYRHGHVASIGTGINTVSAVVRGSQDYAVSLSSDDGVLDYACDCPQGAEGLFCKHCVAAALAWLNRDATPAKPRSRRKAKAITLADAAKVLRNEEKETLLRMILEWAGDDNRLRERVVQYAARQLGPESGAAAASQAFDKAVRVHSFIHYREVSAWARGVDDAIDNIARLLEDGHAPAVIELCDSALQKLVRAAEGIDDSDGHIATLRDRLQEIHFRACEEARPDPVALAGRLFEWELGSELDIFYGAAHQYAGILGVTGLQEYRRRAEAEWQKVPSLTARDDESEWAMRFQITHIMESLARASGDTEELVTVIGRDLSHAYSYLRIAEVYRETEQYDKALIWAEKGLEAFPERTDSRLRGFAAEEYHRLHRHDDAMRLMWAEFSDRPCTETYRLLERHAKKSGQWPEWRERALAEFRRRIEPVRPESTGQAKLRWMRPNSDHSQLVEVYLYENDVEAAWTEAQAGGCSDRLWLELAARRQEAHPADAARIYLNHAEAAVNATRNGKYDDSVHLLVKAAAVMKHMGQSGEFVRSLDEIKRKYKMKRNFIKLLEQERQSLHPA